MNFDQKLEKQLLQLEKDQNHQIHLCVMQELAVTSQHGGLQIPARESPQGVCVLCVWFQKTHR